MRVAFYAPLKPPTHPTPSGDRRMARLIIDALGQGGHDPILASRFRSHDDGRRPGRAGRLAAFGPALAARAARQLAPLQPAAWLTYHLYYKAPDWLGPAAARALGIPYVAIEASVAMKRASGRFAAGHAATVAALGLAAAVVSLNPADDEGLLPHLPAPDRLAHLAPFLDAAPFAAAADDRAGHRAAQAGALGLDPGIPWILAVAMMRPGDKLASYRVLGEALLRLADRPWTLLVAGDGPARAEVEAALGPLGAARLRWLGAVGEAALPGLYAAADLLAWPAINEAYGMALLEGQAAGLPVVAGAVGGVPAIVADGRTGLLAPPGDAAAFAAALAGLLADPARRRGMAAAARAKVAEGHDLPAAAATLDALLRRVTGRP